MAKVTIKPDVLQWALVRSGDSAALEQKFPKLSDWLAGRAAPSLKQVEKFARAARVPVGFLFLNAPPEEHLPIADLRTFEGHGVQQPSPDLLDTIYLCQRRQAWYREYAEETGEEPREFIGSLTLRMPPEKAAAQIGKVLSFDIADRKTCATWSDALRLFVEKAENSGVLVMVSGVVGSNNTRKLDPREFRGFALADQLAPLVFINGADTKAAQMFTLAHELAHLWLGESAVSNISLTASTDQNIEVWCNRVAAELLVPLADLNRELARARQILSELPELARSFKVSTLVILRRLQDAGRINQQQFQASYNAEVARLVGLRRSGGGDFYLTQAARISRRFARAVVTSTLEGQTLYRDAFQMLGIKREQTFQELGAMLEVTG
jgi:Zn-dependent peptidase ImmA (M78 family)